MNLTDLIERFEAIKADLSPRGLTMTEYEQVGWARRPLQALIDQAREEAESMSWDELRSRTATTLLAQAPSTPPDVRQALDQALEATLSRSPSLPASTFAESFAPGSEATP